MKRQFEFKDDKSSKFWGIEIQDNDVTVCYGKIGTDGQTKTKSYDSVETADKEGSKLINQKTKKGYIETTE